MVQNNILEVVNISKAYGLPPLLPFIKKANRNYILRNISFNLKKGESIGVLGKNGAGKSTLLKLLAGVTPPDEGSINIYGSLFPMIELNAGMSMELNGRENIKLLSTVMGLCKKNTSEFISKVAEFSELGDWLSKPVWQYSSGMLARLGFSIAVCSNSDILLVDEVLSVGDFAFQKKCEDEMKRLIRQGTSLVFISHSSQQIERICDRAILIENSSIVIDDQSKKVSDIYLSQFHTTNTEQKSHNQICNISDIQRDGTGTIRVLNAELFDIEDNQKSLFTVGEEIVLKIDYRAFDDIRDWVISIRIIDEQYNVISLFQPYDSKLHPQLNIEDTKSIRVKFRLTIFGRFSFTLKIASTVLIDYLENIAPFSVVHSSRSARETANVGFIYTEAIWFF